MGARDRPTDYWNSLPGRMAQLLERILDSADSHADVQDLRDEAADLLQAMSNRLELALRQASLRQRTLAIAVDDDPAERRADATLLSGLR